MFGYVAFYKEVFQRLYMNRAKTLADVHVPCLYGDEHFHDILQGRLGNRHGSGQ